MTDTHNRGTTAQKNAELIRIGDLLGGMPKYKNTITVAEKAFYAYQNPQDDNDWAWNANGYSNPELATYTQEEFNELLNSWFPPAQQ